MDMEHIQFKYLVCIDEYGDVLFQDMKIFG